MKNVIKLYPELFYRMMKVFADYQNRNKCSKKRVHIYVMFILLSYNHKSVLLLMPNNIF